MKSCDFSLNHGGTRTVYQVLHEFEDFELAPSSQQRLLGGKLQIHPEFAELTSRESRKAEGEVRHGNSNEVRICNGKKDETL